MPAPKPHDPRTTAVSPEQVTEAVDRILSEPAETLADEVEQLTRAHAVLQDALQN